jgi:hypothetical protein
MESLPFVHDLRKLALPAIASAMASLLTLTRHSAPMSRHAAGDLTDTWDTIIRVPINVDLPIPRIGDDVAA